MFDNSERKGDQTIQLTSEPSDELLRTICEAADVIACECPGYLVRLLRQARIFRNYTNSCIETFPEDEATHRWLSEQAKQWESSIYATICELMEREQLLERAGEVSLGKLQERARANAMKQLNMSESQ